MRHYRNYLLRFALIGVMLCLTGCASNAPDLQSMLVNLSASYPALWQLITATAYVLGFFMALKAIYYLKIYGEMRTMMANESSIKTPATLLLVAGVLIYSPTAFQVLMNTTFGTAQITPLSYSGTTQGWTQASTNAVLGLVQVFGLIAFVRGWVYFARAGEKGAQPGMFGKGLTHIMGGLLAINIVGFKDVIWNTFGFGS